MTARTYDDIIAELDYVTTGIALSDPEGPGFDHLCARQEELIREMNSHPRYLDGFLTYHSATKSNP